MGENIFKIGLVVFIVGLIMFGESLSRLNFTRIEPNQEYSKGLVVIEGEYVAISGGKSSSPRICIKDAISDELLGCTFLQKSFSRRSPDFNGKKAVAWVDVNNGIGIVKLIVDGEEVLNPASIQQEFKRNIDGFFYCFAFFALCVIVWASGKFISSRSK